MYTLPLQFCNCDSDYCIASLPSSSDSRSRSVPRILSVQQPFQPCECLWSYGLTCDVTTPFFWPVSRLLTKKCDVMILLQAGQWHVVQAANDPEHVICLATQVTADHAHLVIYILYTGCISEASGGGDSSVIERRTRDWKVAGSNPCWNGGRIFFSRVDFLCWLLFRYPFHPRVTTVARKKSRHSAKSAAGRLQLNTHTPYVCGFYWTVLRHWSQLVPNMSNDIWGH